MKLSNINNQLVGYVLYERDLEKEQLNNCITNVFKSHDIFRMNLKEQGKLNDNYPEISEIPTFDEVFFIKDIEKYVRVPMRNEIVDIELIYFNNLLRGYLFKFNSDVFDERSLELFIKAVEKEYFDHNSKSSSTSYVKYLKENDLGFEIEDESDANAVNVKKIVFGEEKINSIDKFLRTYSIKKDEFFKNIISIYYSKALNSKEFTYAEKQYDSKLSVMGKLDTDLNRLLSINENESLFDVLKSDKGETDKSPEILISVLSKYKDIKGKVRRFIPNESKYSLEFYIDEYSDINIIYKTCEFKREDINTMASRIKKLVDVFMNEPLQMYDKLSLLTDREENSILFKYTDVDYVNRNKKIYDQFISLRIKMSERIALTENSKSYTYLDISKKVLSLVHRLEKQNVVKGSLIGFDAKSDLDAIVFILAIDSIDCVYSIDINMAAYVIKSGVFGNSVIKKTDKYLNSKFQYISKGVSFTRANFQIYCEWYNKYFETKEDDTLLITAKKNTVDYLVEVLPMLLSKGRLVSRNAKMNLPLQIDKDSISILHLDSELIPDILACNELKHVITNKSINNENSNIKIHLTKFINREMPFISINDVKSRNLIGSLVPGIGLLLINESEELCMVTELGKLYSFGNFVNSIKHDIHRISLNGKVFEGLVKTDIKAKWNNDSELEQEEG